MKSSLSHTPLEAPDPQLEEIPYLGYWPAHLEADRRLSGAQDLAKLAVAGSVFVRDPEQLTKMPALVPTGQRTPTGIIQTWDRGLGAFNHLEDAGGDLLRGAAVILQENRRKSVGEFPVVTGEPSSVVEAFLDIADQLDVSEQQPTPTLLLAGQLVHKAAWKEADAGKQEDLFGVAEGLYERIHTDPDVPWGDEKIKAAEYGADIRFHSLSTRIRKARKAKEDLEEYRDEAIGLLRGQIGDLSHMHDLVESSSTSRIAKAWTGDMLEMFASIAVRDHVFVRSPLKGNHSEVRTAFRSEDEPLEPRERKVDSSFDLVIDKVDTCGAIVEATPVQLKLGEHADNRPKAYDPAIHVVNIKNIGGRRMMQAGREMLMDYASHDHRQGRGVLHDVQMVLEPLLSRPRSQSR